MLYDWEHRRSANIDFQSFGFEQDGNDLESETRFIDHLLQIVPGRLGLKEFVRLGLRRKYLFETEMSFESVLTILNTKLLRQDELSHFLPKITDSMFVFNSIGKPFGYHITVGPARRGELRQLLEVNQDFHLDPRAKATDFARLKERYPETSGSIIGH